MRARFGLFILPLMALSCAGIVAQGPDLGPGFTKVKDGIYVYAPDATTTTCAFVVTLEGVVNNELEKNVAGMRASTAGLSFGPVHNNLRVENPRSKRS